MALNYKIRSESGELMATARYVEDAAAIVAIMGDGAKVETPVVSGYLIVWTEGAEGVSAAESYDRASDVMLARIKAFRAVYEAGKNRESNLHWVDDYEEIKRIRREVMKQARAAAAAVTMREDA